MIFPKNVIPIFIYRNFGAPKILSHIGFGNCKPAINPNYTKSKKSGHYEKIVK